MDNFKSLEHQKEPISFVRKLCEDQSEEELVMIEENFRSLIRFINHFLTITKNEELSNTTN